MNRPVRTYLNFEDIYLFRAMKRWLRCFYLNCGDHQVNVIKRLFGIFIKVLKPLFGFEVYNPLFHIDFYWIFKEYMAKLHLILFLKIFIIIIKNSKNICRKYKIKYVLFDQNTLQLTISLTFSFSLFLSLLPLSKLQWIVCYIKL